MSFTILEGVIPSIILETWWRQISLIQIKWLRINVLCGTPLSSLIPTKSLCRLMCFNILLLPLFRYSLLMKSRVHSSRSRFFRRTTTAIINPFRLNDLSWLFVNGRLVSSLLLYLLFILILPSLIRSWLLGHYCSWGKDTRMITLRLRNATSLS